MFEISAAGFGVLFTIMCVRTHKFLSYASSAIFRTCYSLSVRLSYVHVRAAHDDCILCIKRILQWAIGRLFIWSLFVNLCLVCQFIFNFFK